MSSKIDVDSLVDTRRLGPMEHNKGQVVINKLTERRRWPRISVIFSVYYKDNNPDSVRDWTYYIPEIAAALLALVWGVCVAAIWFFT